MVDFEQKFQKHMETKS